MDSVPKLFLEKHLSRTKGHMSYSCKERNIDVTHVQVHRTISLFLGRQPCEGLNGSMEALMPEDQ